MSKIEFLNDKLKFYRNALLAISSGIIFDIYNVVNKKALNESIYLAIIGMVVVFVLAVRIKFLENEITNLMEE